MGRIHCNGDILLGVGCGRAGFLDSLPSPSRTLGKIMAGQFHNANVLTPHCA
jgi:hypothetical protein